MDETIQIMCGLMVLSLGLILVSSSFSPQFMPVYFTLLKSAYPFTAAFYVQSSLTRNTLSCLSAVVDFILLSIGLVALGHASQQCDLDKEVTPSLQYNYYYDLHTYNAKVCFVATTSVTVSILRWGIPTL
nr:membrane-spanning 4-domains subfamily A member 6A-like [Loxodonta africana]